MSGMLGAIFDIGKGIIRGIKVYQEKEDSFSALKEFVLSVSEVLDREVSPAEIPSYWEEDLLIEGVCPHCNKKSFFVHSMSLKKEFSELFKYWKSWTDIKRDIRNALSDEAKTGINYECLRCRKLVSVCPECGEISEFKPTYICPKCKNLVV